MPRRATKGVSLSPLALFGRCFREQRLQRRLTQEEVLERLIALEPCELSPSRHENRLPSWLSRVESGEVPRLDPATIRDLAGALGCDEVDQNALLLAAGFWPLPVHGPIDWATCRTMASHLQHRRWQYSLRAALHARARRGGRSRQPGSQCRDGLLLKGPATRPTTRRRPAAGPPGASSPGLPDLPSVLRSDLAPRISTTTPTPPG